jgi:hypothetical protein
MEALYILHAGACLATNNAPPYTVTVNYSDGSKPGWAPPRRGALNVDWLAPAVRSFPEDWGASQTTAATTVPLGNGRRGVLYRTEWILDRAKHDVPVESVTLSGTTNGVGLILGMTAVTQW